MADSWVMGIHGDLSSPMDPPSDSWGFIISPSYPKYPRSIHESEGGLMGENKSQWPMNSPCPVDCCVPARLGLYERQPRRKMATPAWEARPGEGRLYSHEGEMIIVADCFFMQMSFPEMLVNVGQNSSNLVKVQDWSQKLNTENPSQYRFVTCSWQVCWQVVGPCFSTNLLQVHFLRNRFMFVRLMTTHIGLIRPKYFLFRPKLPHKRLII